MARKEYQAPQATVMKIEPSSQMLAGSNPEDGGHGGGNAGEVPVDPDIEATRNTAQYTPYKLWDNEGW